MPSDALIKRLRRYGNPNDGPFRREAMRSDMRAAADRIEELEAEATRPEGAWVREGEAFLDGEVWVIDYEAAVRDAENRDDCLTGLVLMTPPLDSQENL